LVKINLGLLSVVTIRPYLLYVLNEYQLRELNFCDEKT